MTRVEALGFAGLIAFWTAGALLFVIALARIAKTSDQRIERMSADRDAAIDDDADRLSLIAAASSAERSGFSELDVEWLRTNGVKA